MKIAAIVSTATIAGSIAFAAGQQSGGKQSSVMPRGAEAHSMQEEMPQPIAHAQILGGGCQTEPQAWFNPIPRRLVVCIGGDQKPSQIGKYTLGVADVNADGVNEFFDTAYFGSWDNDGYPETGVMVASFSQPIGGTILYRSTTEVQPSSTVVWRNSVLEGTAAMGDQIRQLIGAGSSLQEIAVRAKGWRDIDFDGDLDLVAEASFFSYGGVDIWFENTGYEASQPPLAADLNNDGIVDGADLGILLSVWGEPN